MIGFFIKKAFFDGWDNIIGLVLFNLGHLAFLLLALASLYFVEVSSVLMFLCLALLLFANSVYTGAVSNAVYSYSAYKRDSWSDFRSGFSRYFRHSLLYFAVSLALCFLIGLVIPFYYSMNNVVGLFITVVLVWLVIFVALALPYFFPLSSYLPGDRPLKTLRKCFIIMMDNLGFSIFFLLYNIVCLAISIFTLGLIPGGAGMNLASHDAIRLLMIKYDYLEENSKENRKKLPWDELLYEEREKVGPRGIKSMIFPWR